jgi:signal transduction histidine kinase
MKELYRNPELKKITFKFMVLYMILCIIAFIFIKVEIKNLSHKLITQNSGIAGKLINNHPDLEDEIIGAFTKGIDEETVIKGEKILETYGYKKDMDLSLIPVIKNFYYDFKIDTLSLMIIFFITIISLIIFEYRDIFNKVKYISTAVERVVEGDYSVKLADEREGDFSILGHQFNEMADRLKNSIEQLKKEKVFLKDIISDISHQLKTPLSSLIVFNELFLTNSVKEEETKHKFYEKTKNQLYRMEWLIKSLLKLAKIEAQAVEFDIENNLLTNTVEKGLEPLKNKWKEKNQTVNIIKNQDNIYLNHDINWSAEAITNIVKNCIEHTMQEGTITVELIEAALFIKLIIKDNGEGIDKEDFPHIFERFYKGKRSKKSDSIGIGLAMSKSIIESQGGSISVKSKKGEGTVFDITFLKGIV